ncbi:YbaB/EbfC family nucleoid-associated protein [Nocardia pneumoniae]|uniref:YbaB/EbfC family nucleoid-associated protein n=1 Tax=Nocardia pneumoniae TaxID=228601 RepID=UPI0012F67E9C|nr:YbaB/EbfC family nucleoid-associated protein [Nocardia pneumoniae]
MYSATNEMKSRVNSLLDGLDRLRADLPGVCERLTASRSSAWSSDHLVEVTVDVYGVVVAVQLAANACGTSTPERLARSMTEAARAAAASAREQLAEIVAPLSEAYDLPDLPDLFPGASSLREIRDVIGAAVRTDTSAVHTNSGLEREI